MQPRPEPIGSLRRVQWAQIAIYTAISLALLGTALHNVRSVRGAARTVARGVGERLLHTVRQADRPGEAPTQSDLDFVLRAQTSAGLRCIVFFDREGDPTTRAGQCYLDDEALASAVVTMRPGQLVQIGQRFAMVHAPPRGPRRGGRREHRPPPGGEGMGRGGPPPDRSDPRRGGPPPGADHLPPGDPPPHAHGPYPGGPPPDASGVHRGGPPPAAHRGRPGFPPPGFAHPQSFLIEFEPLQANALLSAVTRSAIVAGLAILALLAGGIVLWRLSRRAETLQAAAERDRQLVSLGTMSAVLAHEIRNPLASLKGHAQLLAEELTNPGKDHDKATRIVHEAQRLEQLTQDLLSLTGTGRVEPRDTDPAALLREAASSLDLQPAVALHTDEAPPTWRLDALRMHQVLTNLIRNAADASPDEQHAEASVRSEGGRLVFVVRDHGAGIAPGDEERIFEPFYTTRVRGTGLGLAVSRRIVDLHGGSLTARNHPTGGAQFLVVIP